MAFDEKMDKNKVGASLIPEPSGLCKCGQPVYLRLASVVNENTGACHTGPASSYMFWKNNVKGQTDWSTLEMRGSWIFQSWENKCTGCANGDIAPGKRKYTDKQVQVAWRWMMGEMSQGSSTMPFKKLSLTDEQRDTAVEIVNYEGHRTHAPDSIPDGYKLAEVWV